VRERERREREKAADMWAPRDLNNSNFKILFKLDSIRKGIPELKKLNKNMWL
jgi:hypothetical protein